jgi:hypothetical protein
MAAVAVAVLAAWPYLPTTDVSWQTANVCLNTYLHSHTQHKKNNLFSNLLFVFDWKKQQQQQQQQLASINIKRERWLRQDSNTMPRAESNIDCVFATEKLKKNRFKYFTVCLRLGTMSFKV